MISGPIEVTVLAEAGGVRLIYGAEQFQGETEVELVEVEDGIFKGEIPVFTGLDNGEGHVATAVPWNGSEEENTYEEGEAVDAWYTIDLEEPGEQALWQTGDSKGTGFGEVRAIGVLQNGDVLELGMAGKGQSRCYLHRRGKGGILIDNRKLLPGVQCEAIDMTIGDDDRIAVLMRRRVDGEWFWVLVEIPEWGAEPQEIDVGSKDEVAYALAEFNGTLAVCGAAPTVQPSDLTDAMVVIFPPGELGKPQLFDYAGNDKKHQYDDRATDCGFLDAQKLFVVGDTYGKHDEIIDEYLTRRFDLVYDMLEGTGEPEAAGAQAKQSFATAVAVDTISGRVAITGYVCNDDNCTPDARLWEVDAEGTQVSETSLGLYKIPIFAPHDVVWSPANYVIVASGGLLGENTEFVVRGYELGNDEPLWIYSRKDVDVINVALTVAAGAFGEVYAGGWGADGYPAFAIIFG
ncbi:MAG TPA: hypothetical protein ENK31_08815 [Nannocystis exedens]|nr:hypothetical protein [Nannocystis exedens]